jgi:hypothetical protein
LPDVATGESIAGSDQSTKSGKPAFSSEFAQQAQAAFLVDNAFSLE